MLAGILPDLDKFDGDEVFLLFGSGIVCLFGLGHWLFRLRPVSKLGCHPLYRAPFYFAVLAGFLLLGRRNRGRGPVEVQGRMSAHGP